MSKVLIFGFIFFTTICFGKVETFNAIASLNTKTLSSGTFSIGKAPLGNLNSSIFTSSINVGLFDRFEIGTAPIFYSYETHKRNYNFKILVFDGEYLDWSLSGGEIILNHFDQIETSNVTTEMHLAQLAVNINIPDSRYKVGMSTAQSCGTVVSNYQNQEIKISKCTNEFGIDLQYEIQDNLWLTLGRGRMRETGITPFENVTEGFGAAITIFRKSKFLSRPSLGHYISENGQNTTIVTTTFYET